MEEFNSTIQLHQRLTNDSQSSEILTKLANASDDHDRFAFHTLTGFQFWRNVYNLLQTLDVGSKLLWSSVSVVDSAIQQAHTRDFLVHTMDYVPLVAELILRSSAKCTVTQKMQIHQVFDNLCTDYCSASDQPVFFNIVRHLVKTLYAHQAPHDRPLAVHSMSALISLCHHNACVLLHFRHQVQVAELCDALSGLPVLGARMQILMTRTSGGSGDEIDAHMPNMLYMVGSQLAEVSRTNCATAITHLTRLIDDMCAHRDARQQSGAADEPLLPPDLVNAFGSLLQSAQQSVSAAADPPSIGQLNLLDALLRLCSAVVRLAAASIGAHYNSFTNLAIDVLELSGEAPVSHTLAGTAIDTIRCIVMHAPSVASLFSEKLLSLLRNRLDETSKTAVAPVAVCPQFVALFRLLDCCLDKVPATAVDLIAPDIFDRLWQPLVEHQVNPFALVAGQLLVFVQSLHLLLRCSRLEPDNGQRADVLRQLFARTPLHYVIAVASQSADRDMQRLVFGLAKSTYFPDEAIITHIATLRQRSASATGRPAVDGNGPLLAHPTAATTSATCCTLSAQHSARLVQLMDNVQTAMAQRGGAAAHLSSTHIIDLYRHKLRDSEQRESQLLAGHERTLRTVREQQHALVQQSRVLSAYDATVYAAVASEEVLSGELELLRRDRTHMAKATQDLNAKLERVVERGERERREAGQRLQIAEVEIQNFKKQIDTEQQKAKADEKRRERDMKEQQKLNEVLKQSLAKYETRVAEHEERERKVREELAAEKVRCRSALAVKESTLEQLKQLEGQLNDKHAELERLKTEQEADNELRNSIMKMIQKKTSSSK